MNLTIKYSIIPYRRIFAVAYLAPYRIQTTVQLTKLICQGDADKDEKQVDEIPRERTENIADVHQYSFPQTVLYPRKYLADTHVSV